MIYETSITNLKKQLKFYKGLSEQLQQENQELKSQLRGTTHCYDEEKHKRLQEENKELKKQIKIKHDGFMASVEEACELAEENQKLKKQLSNSRQIKNQQKEFIEYLENESKELIRDAGYHQRICLDILEKYKEIIGDKE